MKKTQTLRLTLSAAIVAILTLMAFVPWLGFIPLIPAVGASINLLLIPVCIAAIILGKYYGLGAAAYLGVLSLVMAYLRPGGPIDMLFQYPWVSVAPRIFIGPAVYFSYILFKKLFAGSGSRYVREFLPVHIAATCGVLTNTGLVCLSILVTTAVSPITSAIPWLLILLINMPLEIAAVNLLVPPVCAALRRAGFAKAEAPKNAG